VQASTCRRGHYKGVNEIIVFEKDDGHYDVSSQPSTLNPQLSAPIVFEKDSGHYGIESLAARGAASPNAPRRPC
jgi:hypothetical protein